MPVTTTPTASDAVRSVVVLIPAWQPDAGLCALVRELVASGFTAIIVVDDGSHADSRPVFDKVGQHPQVHLLRHAVNLGKGRALKTGANYFLNTFPDMAGLLTADADGQHAPEDIVHTAQVFAASPDRVVLGSRKFAGDVPLRSRFGNVLTRNIFRFVTGRKLVDTQTGLRVFPHALLPELMNLDGERYEYEMTVLAHVCRLRPPIEVPIRTIYVDGNRSSHFDPIRDSMRIYFVLLRFYLSSIIAAGIDMAGFSVAFWLTGNVLTSVVVGRLSSLANFALNKKYVFNSSTPVRGALLRYYLLVLVLGMVSYGSIRALSHFFGWNVFVAKVTVETLLSLVSFAIQRTFVFRSADAE